jgi:hypothetical protein
VAILEAESAKIPDSVGQSEIDPNHRPKDASERQLAKINDHFLRLRAGYLFPEIGRRVAKFAAENPQAKIIRLGIGDVPEPFASGFYQVR